MSIYTPATSGLPQYFLSMLEDKARNSQYEAAIKLAISEFTAAHGRAPSVVDLGCGTGMLSVFALRHGAASVTAIDTNQQMAGTDKLMGMCEQALVNFAEAEPGSKLLAAAVKWGEDTGGVAESMRLVREKTAPLPRIRRISGWKAAPGRISSLKKPGAPWMVSIT